MKVDHLAKAQNDALLSQNNPSSNPPYPLTYNSTMPLPAGANGASVYPALGDYMGLELSETVLEQNMPEYSQLLVYQSRNVRFMNELILGAGFMFILFIGCLKWGE